MAQRAISFRMAELKYEISATADLLFKIWNILLCIWNSYQMSEDKKWSKQPFFCQKKN